MAAVQNGLNGRFGEITDMQHAFVLLHKIKQRPDESVYLFAETLLTLAQDTFLGQRGDGIATISKRQLINIFIYGLHYDYFKMKVMRDNPATLQAAIMGAMSKQNLRKCFNMRSSYIETVDKPM